MTKIELIDGWKKAYRLYTFWMSVIIAVMPDILNLAIRYELITADEIPTWFSQTLKLATVAWMAARLVKQKSLEKQAEQTAPTP